MDSHKDEKASLSSEEGHDVYPLHALDDTKLNAHMVTITLVFNDVLDVDKLQKGLLTLFSLGDWKKLTGRLKRKSDGKYELHVPKQYDDKNPATTFTHYDYSDVNMADHELGKQVPQPTHLPSSHKLSSPTDLLPLATRKDFPKTVDELVDRNLPVLGFHFTSFKDATAIGIIWPHSLMDAASQRDMISSWAMCVSGREAEVRPVLGAKDDVLSALDTAKLDGDKEAGKRAKKEKALFEKKQLSLVRKILFILNFLYMRRRNPFHQTRMMYLPPQALEALQKEHQAGGDAKQASTNDLLVAWATKLITSARGGSRSVTLVNLLNARGRLPLVDQTKGIYLQNMAGIAFTFLTKSQVEDSTVNELAVENRRQLMTQATEEEMTLFIRSVRDAAKKGKTPNLICGDSVRSYPLFCNSLASASPSKAANFVDAVVRAGDSSELRCNDPGNAFMLLHQGVRGYVKLGESFYVVHKTHGGGMWMMATVTDKAWAKFDAELERLTKGMKESPAAVEEKTVTEEKPVVEETKQDQ